MADNPLKKHALFIGVGQRPNDKECMKISASDAEHLRRIVSGLTPFKGIETQCLVNDDANKKSITEALSQLAVTTEKEPADLVIVYFSGHGYKSGDSYYLICRDTLEEDVHGTALAGSRFVAYLRKIKCDKMLVLLDCCHSAGINIPFDEMDKEDLLKQKNRVIISACKKEQLAYLSTPVSLFTYALAFGLSGKFLGLGEKELKVFNLAMDVREQVVALSKNIPDITGGALQQPELDVLEESGNFQLAKYQLDPGHKLFEEELAALEKELCALTYNGKNIDLNVERKEDKEYRGQFPWMITETTIQNVTNGVAINNANGNTITINYGISTDDLTKILVALKYNTPEMVVELTKHLTKQDSQKAVSLANRIRHLSDETVKIRIEHLLNSINTLTRKQNSFEEALDRSDSPSKKFELEENLREIKIRIEEYKKELHGNQ